MAIGEGFPEQQPEFDIAGRFDEEEKTRMALEVNKDLLDGLTTGEIRAGDTRASDSVEAIEELMGECDYPSYCKFYGENPGFCDRTCSMSIWDQI